ncbi:hypothetical protein HY373_01230 [Candidatus Berkelbacteria bacterium]|nr:hypothetical protein [Candidatus Berkelbacteria bacterium]MBI4029783.1 hypothetical protein [Candidatus Berkelbacteria bacterium]
METSESSRVFGRRLITLGVCLIWTIALIVAYYGFVAVKLIFLLFFIIEMLGILILFFSYEIYEDRDNQKLSQMTDEQLEQRLEGLDNILDRNPSGIEFLCISLEEGDHPMIIFGILVFMAIVVLSGTFLGVLIQFAFT